MQRTYVYVDGFNLYYRGLKGSPYKWLDIKSLCQKLLNRTHQINAIKYFTAIVSGKFDPQSPVRQQTYIRALGKHIPEFSVYYGHFLTNPARAKLASPPLKGSGFVEVIKTEEKGSDVNLALHLLNDAWLDKYDCAVIISNDSDLVEAINLVKKQHDKKIGLILPLKCSPSRTLISKVDFTKRIRNVSLLQSQLPDCISGTKIYKPEKW